MTYRVLVTGASGTVGSSVVTAATDLGLDVRPGGSRTDPMLDLTDPKTFAAACRGVDGIFLMRPPAISRVGPTLNAFIDQAVVQGARSVVFLSVSGAGSNRLVPHHRVETRLMAAPLTWTILRPGFFAQNLLTAYRQDIINDDHIVVPAGHGKVAFVDTRDVADVAAMALAEPDAHDQQAYTLTGPRAYDFADVADLLTQALGRPIRYDPATAVGYVRHLLRQGLPLAQVLVQTVLHLGLRRGDAEDVDPTLTQLLGRPARTIADVIADHRHQWERPGGR